jgi:hypothetical protein
MELMFFNATSFNQPREVCDVRKISNIESLFQGTLSPLSWVSNGDSYVSDNDKEPKMVPTTTEDHDEAEEMKGTVLLQ